MTTEKKHWLKPLAGKVRPARHLLLWVDTDESKPILKRLGSCAWDVVANGPSIQVWHLGEWKSTEQLEVILDASTKGKGTLTVWLARGWEDLVLTGLAELLDCQACTWRYANLDGQKLLIRGLWRGRPVIITSLANWTGSRWDRWPQAMEDEAVCRYLPEFNGGSGVDVAVPIGQHRRFVATWLAIAKASSDLGCTSVAPSVAAGSIQMWRRWLGPRIKTTIERPCGKKRERKPCPTLIVAPSPFRSERSAEAERHSVYGLVTRQLRRGFVDETLYCVDLRSAYLLALLTTPVPLQFRGSLYRPSLEELIGALAQESTGHALVRLETDVPYPCRISGTVLAATGHYWTWLAGAELARAVADGHVQQIETAYLWHGGFVQERRTKDVLGIADLYRRDKCPALASVWRSLYSALVGQFACRRKRWEDCPDRHGVGRWAQWEACRTGSSELVRYRSIAGRTQRLVERCDTSAAVPLLYSCVTAQVRSIMRSLTELAGVANVACIHADSLWVTQSGWQELQRAVSAQRMPPDSLATKAIYDRAWFSGKTLVVVERKGQRFLLAPGVGDGAVLDERNRCEGRRAVAWNHCESIDAEHGCQRRKVVFAGQRVLDKYSTPAVALPIGEPLDDSLLREELLLPVRHKRQVNYE